MSPACSCIMLLAVMLASSSGKRLLGASMRSDMAAFSSKQETLPVRARTWRPAFKAILRGTAQAGFRGQAGAVRLASRTLTSSPVKPETLAVANAATRAQHMRTWIGLQDFFKHPASKRDQILDVSLNGFYDYRVDTPKYEPSTDDQKLNQEVVNSFKRMAEGVVHRDAAYQLETAALAEASAGFPARMDDVHKFVDFLNAKERKEKFVLDWSKRAAGSPERNERLTQLAFVLSVVEDTQAFFADTQPGHANLSAGDWTQTLDAKSKASKTLQMLQGIVKDVLMHTTGNNLNKGLVHMLQGADVGPESWSLEKINKLLAQD